MKSANQGRTRLAGGAVREYGRKIALGAIALCYPAANASSHLAMWVLFRINPEGTPTEQVAVLLMGNLFFVGVGLLMWLAAVLAGADVMQVDGDAERRVGRLAFGVVLLATAAIAAAFLSGQFLMNMDVS